ncbi:MAG: hypothetical protein N3B12_05185 [Armatimonadetes bacterium]|nr:hypothetical protein [Armatimonadota bacterium]
MSKEPARCTNISSLWEPFRRKVERLLERMRGRGFDPIIFEAARSRQRQEWLYGVGRTHHKGRKPVTWTMTSRHLVGKAADIVSKSRGWDWPEFFDALKSEASRLGLETIPQEGCHVQWR